MKSTIPKDLETILCLSAGRGLPDPDPVEHIPCCDSYAYLGPEHCMCWEEVYDTEQAEPRPGEAQCTRARMCSDCAFRPGSPERTDEDRAASDSGDLLRIVHDPRQMFWCHDGMRSIIGHRHPNGMYVPVDPAARAAGVVAYSPPIVDGVPYRADGSPGLHCAGLAAARRAKDWLP